MYHNIQLCSPDDVCHGTEVETDRNYEEVELEADRNYEEVELTPFTMEHNMAYSTTHTTVATLMHEES